MIHSAAAAAAATATATTTHSTHSDIPWIEKYRPASFDDIILSPSVKKLLSNIIPLPHKDVPNLLFFGPPGTGKTTTIMRWISLYHAHNNEKGRDLVLHLNASDERGLDTVRERIEKFTMSGNLFSVGMKFVIMDEFDAMTPSAQYAFKEVVRNVRHDIRFMVICNYIHRIERTIRDEFMNIEFTSIPRDDTTAFLTSILTSEGLPADATIISNIYERFCPDIRSMINYIQSNRHILMPLVVSGSPASTAAIKLPAEHNILARNRWLIRVALRPIDGVTPTPTPTPTMRQFKEHLNLLAIHANVGVRVLLADLTRQLTRQLLDISAPTAIQLIAELKLLSHTSISLEVLVSSYFLLLRKILAAFPALDNTPDSALTASP